MLYQVETGSGLMGIKYVNADSEAEAIEKAKDILFDKELIYDQIAQFRNKGEDNE